MRARAHHPFQRLGWPVLEATIVNDSRMLRPTQRLVAGASFAPSLRMNDLVRTARELGYRASVIALACALPSLLLAQRKSDAPKPPATPRWIVVSNERSHDLTVIDGATLRFVETVPVGARARGVHVSRDHRNVLVALSDDRPQTPGPNDAIAEVDLATRRVTRRISSGTDPEQFTITPDGRRLVAANEDAGNASIIDATSGAVVATLVVGTEPEGVQVSPDGRWVYVTGETSNTISVIDMRTEKVVSTFLVDARPRSVAFSPNGRFAYATSEVGGSIARIDARRHRVLERARIGNGEEKPVGVAVSPDGTRLYVALGAGHALVKLDAATLRELGRVAVGRRPWGVSLSPDGRFAYTANGLTDDMSVVDVAAMRVTQTVKVGTRPWGVAVVP
jgi:PQQ-dependent catabolism-associated beta-propeller protein